MPRKCMPVREALKVLCELRDDQTMVVTNQGSARLWPLLREHPLDFHYNPSTMGGAIPFGLGLALSDSLRPVIVISGDGALTMSLGTLVTVVASGVQNFTVVVLDNGLYEVTGGQRIAASDANVDYAALARSVGFPAAFRFDDLEEWNAQAADVFQSAAPRLIALVVDRADARDMQTELKPILERLQNFEEAFSRRKQQDASN